VPHMGWNTCDTLGTDPLLDGIGTSDYFYFVHSFAAPVSAATTASVDYGGPFSAAVAHGTFRGVQFHPERSAQAGARVLASFLRL